MSCEIAHFAISRREKKRINLLIISENEHCKRVRSYALTQRNTHKLWFFSRSFCSRRSSIAWNSHKLIIMGWPFFVRLVLSHLFGKSPNRINFKWIHFCRVSSLFAALYCFFVPSALRIAFIILNKIIAIVFLPLQLDLCCNQRIIAYVFFSLHFYRVRKTEFHECEKKTLAKAFHMHKAENRTRGIIYFLPRDRTKHTYTQKK